MLHKFVKLSRRLRALPTRPGSLPVGWHVGRPNFGDDLNPALWSVLLNRPVRLATRRFKGGQPHLLGIGSILETATEHSIVCGSGFLCPDPPRSIRPSRLIAVRGQLTADRLATAPECLGDPAVLVDRVFPQSRQVGHEVGLIPHFSQINHFRRFSDTGAFLIDPAWSPSRVLAAICSCERIISQSLHGLIIADAYGIPNAWVAPSDSMKGGDFKFRDYYSTTDASKSPLPIRRLGDAITTRSVDMFVSRFRFDKSAYMAAIREVACDGLSQTLTAAA